MSTMERVLEEYFRQITHPRIVQLQKKYPTLLQNPVILARLYERYPPGRKTDEEYQRMWEDEFSKEYSMLTCNGEKYYEPMILTILVPPPEER